MQCGDDLLAHPRLLVRGGDGSAAHADRSGGRLLVPVLSVGGRARRTLMLAVAPEA